MEPNSTVSATATPILIDLERPVIWPAPVLEYLVRNQELLCQWEQDASQISAKSYDRAIGELQELLQPFYLKGWHCTRLTDQEIGRVLTDGVALPDLNMLQSRIDALVGVILFSVRITALKQ